MHQKSAIKNLPVKIENTRPPYTMFLVGLVLVVAFAGFLGYQAYRHERVIRENVAALESMWDARVENSSLPNHDQVVVQTEQDRESLDNIKKPQRGLFTLLSAAIATLIVLVLAVYYGYRRFLVVPLRRLEQSCRQVAADGLKGHIWGLDRGDQYGSLARSIHGVREAVEKLSDMEIQNGTSVTHVQFGGQAGSLFNSMISDFQKSLAELKQQGERLDALAVQREEELVTFTRQREEELSTLVRQREENSKQREEELSTLSSYVRQQSNSLENAVETARQQLTGFQNQWSEQFTTLSTQHTLVQEQAKGLVTQFTGDMQVLRQIAGVTGQRVTQMLQNLGTTDNDYKKAAHLSLQASEAFARQAADLTEKMNAATTLLRASGKVMAETTESTRSRLLEAVKSVASHDEAIKSFLSETANKSDQIATMFDDIKQNAVRIADVVVQFDNRMTDFEDRSAGAFQRIERDSERVENAAGQLDKAHELLSGSMDAMRGHTDMLARILVTIREEYTSIMDNWRTSLADATPAVTQLKEASQRLQYQLSDEWAQYTQQSRALLSALENDVRAMNARTAQVTGDAGRLVDNLNAQSVRLSDSASHFDLQVASLSQRLENAAASVLQSNDHVVKLTANQIRDVHSSVQDMVQRLGILTQLTGTLGAVAGQLGQIVPALSDARKLGYAGIPDLTQTKSADPEMAERLEKVGAHFTSTIDQLKGEFGAVRGQITRWVDMLTAGYQKMAEQINTIDGTLETRIGSLKTELLAEMPKPAAQPDYLGTLLPALQAIQENAAGRDGETQEALLQNLENLQDGVRSVNDHVHQTTRILHALSEIIAEGFTRVENSVEHNASQPASPISVDTRRIEQASSTLEQLVRAMQNQSTSFVEKLNVAAANAAALVSQAAPAPQPRVATQPSATAPAISLEAATDLDQLQVQIDLIAKTLEQCAQSSSTMAPPQALDEPTLDKSRAIIEAVSNAITRLNQIAESIERMADNPGPDSGNNGQEKAG